MGQLHRDKEGRTDDGRVTAKARVLGDEEQEALDRNEGERERGVSLPKAGA